MRTIRSDDCDIVIVATIERNQNIKLRQSIGSKHKHNSRILTLNELKWVLLRQLRV